MSLITRFNADNRNFLVLSPGASADNPLLDISHESLIRQWKTLAAWRMRRLSPLGSINAWRRARIYMPTAKPVLPRCRPSGGLGMAQAAAANAQWGARYRPKYELAVSFLEKSVKKQKTNRSLVTSFLVCAYFCIYSWLVIAATDDVSLATNSVLCRLSEPGCHRSDLFVLPLLLGSVYAYFLFTYSVSC